MSLLQLYAINLTIPTLIYAVFQCVNTVIILTGNYNSSLGTPMVPVVKTEFIHYFTGMILYFSGFNYRLLATVFVFITYLFYAKPFFAKQWFSLRNIIIILTTTQITTIFFSVTATYSNRQSGQLVNGVKWNAIEPIIWNDVFEGLFEFFTLSLMILNTLECIRVLVKYHKSNTGNRRTRQVQLISTLAYLTPPNIFLIREFVLHFR